MPKNKGKNQKNQKNIPAKAQPSISLGKQEEVAGSSAVSLARAASDIVCTGELACQPLSKDIKFVNFSLSYFGENLVQDTSLELNFGRRYGLIGRNGSGKTTFLRALAARVLEVPSHIDIYLLEEEVEATEMTPTEAVVDFAQKELLRLETLENRILEEEGGDSPLLDDIYERMDMLEPRTFEKRAGELLFGLGFRKDMINKQTKDLSGGWRMRVAIARALFIKPTLLLLDEPTNHLDLETCVWFEQYLKNYDRILVLVSHSQDFLNGVCTNTIHLTPKKTLVYYGGNYSTFCRTLAENERNQMKQYEKQQEEIKHIKDFIASCGTYANLVRQAKSRQKILDKMEDDGLIEKVEEVSVRKLNFPVCDKLAPPVLAFQDVAFSYDGNLKKCLYTGLEFGIDLDSRIVLVGPNGAGKSTLLKLMDGSLIPTSGFIQRHSHLRIAKYNQHSNDQLDGDLTPIDYMRKEFPEKNLDISEWRQNLGKYGISGKAQTKKISTMSDGQKSQLVFCWLSQKSPHMLLFDEPTNHLDMESIDALAEAINDFQGGMVLVSHDFRLLQQTAKEIWVCDNKKVERWDGDIASYKAELMRRMNDARP